MPLLRRNKQQTIATRMGLKPSLDYLHGYPVEKVRKNSVTFEGGANITFEKDVIPPDVKGMVLATVSYSQESVMLHFRKFRIQSGVQVIVGEADVAVKHGSFTITDPRFNEKHTPDTEPDGQEDEQAQ